MVVEMAVVILFDFFWGGGAGAQISEELDTSYGCLLTCFCAWLC